MPRRTDLRKILLIGSGPIIIGQACEFDYSGTQACKSLREEGYTVVLVNSNPATIMTDPDTADRTYIEPITWEVVARIIERERPDAPVAVTLHAVLLHDARNAIVVSGDGLGRRRLSQVERAARRRGRRDRQTPAGQKRFQRVSEVVVLRCFVRVT